MSRALWEALGEAVDACEAANDEYAHAPTPETRAAMAAAAREYAQRLYPLIGEVEAFRYEASLATYLAAARAQRRGGGWERLCGCESDTRRSAGAGDRTRQRAG